MKDVTNNPILVASKALGRRPARRVRPGFTLIELLVVISIIAIAVSVALPGMIGLFTAGADKQARTMLATMCGAARGRAIENQTYTAVWMQVDKNAAHPRAWIAVLELDQTHLDADGRPRTFIPSTIAPRQIPGDMAFGQMLSSNGPNITGLQSICIAGGNEVFGDVIHPAIVPANRVGNQQVFLQVLSQAVLVFGPDGQLTSKVYGTQGSDASNFPKFGNCYAVYEDASNTRLDFARSRLLWCNTAMKTAVLHANDGSLNTTPLTLKACSLGDDSDANNVGIFTNPFGSDDNGNTIPPNAAYWGGYTTYQVGSPSVTYHNLYEAKRLPPVVSAVTVFNHAAVAAMADGPYTQDGSRSKYLTDGKVYVVVNPYTGQLLPNE